jgi:hypothetical protein
MSDANFLCRLVGHKYRARFHEGKPTVTSLRNVWPSDAVQVIESSKPKTYVSDICERCGSVIQKEKP